MPVAATITVNDRATPTPVAHAFVPAGPLPNNPSSYGFKESGSTPIGEPTLNFYHRESGGKYYKRIVMNVPIVATETVNGISVPKVVRSTLLDLNVRFDAASTEQERANAVGMFYNMLAASQVVPNGAIVKLERIWS